MDLKDSLLYQDLSENYKRIVDICAEYLQNLWSEHRLITYYTDHGYMHSLRVLGRIEELLSFRHDGANGNQLNNDEKFLLILSVIFHDIGMQCDLSKNTSIVNIAKNVYSADFRSEFKGRYTEDNMKEQRKYHHLVSAAWLLYARQHDGSLKQATVRISDAQISCIR